MLKGIRLSRKTEILNIFIIVLSSMLVALGLHVFVYKADFAPSGVDGLATMLQYLSEKHLGYKINAGIITFALNLPLLIAAWFILKKRYVVYTVLYTVVLSVSLMVLGAVSCPQYDCTVPGTYNSHLVAAIFGGVAQGITGVMLRLGGSSGGVDIIGCMLHKKVPHKDVEKIIAYVSYVVVVIAFVVYGNLNSVCLSVICIFVCEKVTAAILKTNRRAVKFEIVADKKTAKEIKNLILFDVCHGATILNGQGAFSEDDKEVIVCLVSYYRLPEFLKLLKNYQNIFLYYTDVMGVKGNFDFHKEDERPEDALLRKQKLSSKVLPEECQGNNTEQD